MKQICRDCGAPFFLAWTDRGRTARVEPKLLTVVTEDGKVIRGFLKHVFLAKKEKESGADQVSPRPSRRASSPTGRKAASRSASARRSAESAPEPSAAPDSSLSLLTPGGEGNGEAAAVDSSQK